MTEMSRLKLIEARLARIERTLVLPPLPVYNCIACGELVTEACTREDCTVQALFDQRSPPQPAAVPATALDGSQSDGTDADPSSYPPGVPGGENGAQEAEGADPAAESQDVGEQRAL